MSKKSRSAKRVKFLVFGCVHATRACPKAVNAVIEFILKNSPELVVINGDLYDMEAFMGGAKGDGEPVSEDIDAGLAILKRVAEACRKVGAKLVFLEGNHEQRLRRYIHSTNEIVAYAAQQLLWKLEEEVRKAGGTYVPYDGIFQQYLITKCLMVTHGSIFNQMSARDMAEMYAKGGVRYVIYNHTHGISMAVGRRDDAPVGYNAGNLLQVALMGYSHNRRQTFAWAQGFAYGVATDEVAYINTHIHPKKLEGKDWDVPRYAHV